MQKNKKTDTIAHMTTFKPARELVNIEKIAKKYKVETITINYKDKDSANGMGYIDIPIKIDLIVRLKAWISYDLKTDTLVYSHYIIGGKNYWITQLQQDHKNKRIDISQYLYEQNRA